MAKGDRIWENSEKWRAYYMTNKSIIPKKNYDLFVYLDHIHQSSDIFLF